MEMARWFGSYSHHPVLVAYLIFQGYDHVSFGSPSYDIAGKE